MNITCIICSDTFFPHSEVYTTQCGHLFHHHCLVQWIERSKTCPQCRSKATEKSIYRIFFTLANSDHIVDDVVTLQNKLDNLQFQMTLKEKDVKIMKEKYSKTKKQNIALRTEVSELENNVRTHDSIIHALKDQITYFKSKSKEKDRLSEELSQVKNQLKDLQMIQAVVNGTREEVNDILRNENNIESLIILSATLKKALLDAEQKKMSAEHKLKQLQNDIHKYRRVITSLESSNEELKKELYSSKTSWEQEKEHLTKIVHNLNKKGAEGNTPIIKRILSESPMPLNLKCTNDSTETVNLQEISSPSVDNKVIDILESDSPYLPVKSNGINIYEKISHTGFLKNSPGKMSIFKDFSSAVINTKSSNNDELAYDGLGGHGRKDIFPTPKNSTVGIKRYKTNSLFNVSSAKHRKLNPVSFSKK